MASSAGLVISDSYAYSLCVQETGGETIRSFSEGLSMEGNQVRRLRIENEKQ